VIGRTGLLVAATLTSGLTICVVAVLALPGPPVKIASQPGAMLQQPAILTPLAVATLVGLLWSLRMWAFRRHVRAPGPIRIVSFDDATAVCPANAAPRTVGGEDGERSNLGAMPSNPLPTNGVPRRCGPAEIAPADGASPPVVRLAMHLRSRLTELRLPVPSAIPGTQASMDFVELLGTTKVDVKQPFASAASILSLIRPSHAYELRATLLRRDREPRRGVAIELTVLPGGAAVFRTYWNDTWEHALDHAAAGVGSQIVPHSAHADTGPWCSWRGKALSEDLFFTYQRAQRRRQQRRYDEALADYYTALRLDPANEHLRHDLGHLQEGRALYLDAWLTYRSIITALEGRCADELDRPADRARQRILILTRYRFTVLLGFGDRLARQWLPPPRGVRPTRRREELDRLRVRLRPILREYLTSGDDRFGASAADLEMLDLDVASTGGPASEDRLDRLDELLSDTVVHRQSAADMGYNTSQPLSKDEIRAVRKRQRVAEEHARAIRKTQLRLLFQLFAEREVQRLLDDIRDRDLERLDTGLSRTALDLLPPSAHLKTEHARILLRRELGQSIPDTSWPPSAERIRELWRGRVSRGRSLYDRLQESRVFVDHYNAACTFAIGLAHEHGHPLAEDVRRDLAEAAVQSLRRALDVADSTAISTNWEWIASKDPDLAALRTQPEFRRFESERLPSSRPAPRRPTDITDLQASQHSVRLVICCARVFEDLWHVRADLCGPTDAHCAMGWWNDEQRAWQLLRTLALHHRHWQTRVEVGAGVTEIAQRYGLPPVRLAQARYAEQPLDADDDVVDREASRVVCFANVRLKALGDVLQPDSRSLPGFREWSAYLQRIDYDGDALDESRRRRLALQRASTWADVGHFVGPELSDEQARVAMRHGLDGLLCAHTELCPVNSMQHANGTATPVV
jgi:hypothetical protein